MPSSLQLREQRANIWDQMTALMDRATDGQMSAEDAVAYDRAESDLDSLEAQIQRIEAHERRAAEYNAVDRRGVVAPGGGGPGDGEPGGDAGDAYASAFAGYMRHGLSALDQSDQRTLRAGWVDAPRNAQGVSSTTAGGYTVPPAFRARIIEQMTYVAAMRQYAEVITTDTGASLPWPTVDDTANEGAILAENTQVTEQDVVFGQATIDAYMYTSKLVRVSLQLLNDNAFNLDGWLARALGARIGRVQNRHFTVGTGTGQPDGIVTSAPVGKVGAAGQVTTVTYDDLVDLTDSIDSAYLNGANARFMLSQAARKVLRKLKDTQGRPLWEPSIQVGVPDNLLGYGSIINNYVPAPAASAKSILFGDYNEAYLIRDVSDIAVLRLSERYADFLQVGFLAFQRSDGTLQNASAVRAYQHPAA